MRRRAVLAASALVLTASLPAAAHHGWSGYDSAALVTLDGTVETVSFEQPHGLLMLQTEGKLWRIVLAPPSRLQHRGLPAGSIRTGDAVSVEGYPHRTDAEEFRAERIRVNGGDAVELR